MAKNPPANAGDVGEAGSILDREDPQEEGMAIHSSILAWRITRTEELGGATVYGVAKIQKRLK